MACAKKDLEQMGVAPPGIYDKLASIGAGGTIKGNMHRDLLRLIDVKVPEGFQIDFPMRGAEPGHWKLVCQEVLLPHELFAHMWDSHRQAFVDFVQGPPGQVEKFWEAMAGNPQLIGHPICDEPNYKHMAIPLGIHGDGGANCWGWQKLVEEH